MSRKASSSSANGSEARPLSDEIFGALIEEVRFARDLYGAFPVKRLLLGFAHSSLFGAGKAVLHPVACDFSSGSQAPLAFRSLDPFRAPSSPSSDALPTIFQALPGGAL